MSVLNFDTWQDSAGANEFFKCRAFVNFNGTGTVAIRADGNIDSITDNGTGDYTVNFTNNMPDADYSINASAGDAAQALVTTDRTGGGALSSRTASNFRLNFYSRSAGAVEDVDYACAAVFR